MWVLGQSLGLQVSMWDQHLLRDEGGNEPEQGRRCSHKAGV